MDSQKQEGPAAMSSSDEAGFEKMQANDTGMRVSLALGKDPRETGTPVVNREFSLPDLEKLLTQHESRAEKMGAYFCAPMAKKRRNGDDALPWNLFPLDFDGKEGDKPDPEASKAWFSEHWHVGYSTHSHTHENGKHRVVLWLNREIDKSEYRALFDAFDAVLPFVPDPKLNHPDQPVFLPSCPPGTTPVAWVNEGKPFDADGFLAQHRRHAEAESRARKAYSPPPQNSVIAQFNAAYPLVAVLESNGYIRRGKRYLHPQSESGIPSVAIFGDGNICVSHSSSDPLGDGKAHDAFDCYAILEHQGDKKAAAKAAAEKVNLNQDSRAKSAPEEDAGAAKPSIDLLDADGKKKSQATLLIEIGSRYELFHDADRNAYAVITKNGAREVWPIRSSGFRHILAAEFFKLTQKGFNRNAAGDAVDTLEAKAIHTGPQHPVYLRVARTEQAIYLDICDDLWRVIEITPDGWRVLDHSPVYFIRKPGMAALPMPAGPGDLGKLRDLVNLDPKAGHFELVCGWMVGALRGRSPYPILVLQGEQGTGKSSGSRIIRRFVDPSNVPLRSPPKEPRDLIVSASNNHLVCLDNLSGINAEISDCLCRFATGGGLDLRKLYTDSDSVLIDIQRPVLVNGIDDICHRPDLAERSVILHFGVLKSDTCIRESKLWKNVEEHSPAIMAGLCDALAAALKNEATTHLTHKPRMADFAVWVTAAEAALPWSPGAFMEAYNVMRGRAIEEGIEASPVGSVLVEFLTELMPVMDWRVTPNHLYETLSRKAGTRANSPSWPRHSRGMGEALKRIAPNLRAVGITWTKKGCDDRSYHFVHTPKNAPDAPDAPEATADAGFRAGASKAHPGGQAHRNGDAPDAPAEKNHAPDGFSSENNEFRASGASGASSAYCTKQYGGAGASMGDRI